MDPLPIFYSLNRFIDHEACISAGSVEICWALFKLDVVGEGTGNMVKQAVEGKLDTCGSVSLSHSAFSFTGCQGLQKAWSQGRCPHRHRRSVETVEIIAGTGNIEQLPDQY